MFSHYHVSDERLCVAGDLGILLREWKPWCCRRAGWAEQGSWRAGSGSSLLWTGISPSHLPGAVPEGSCRCRQGLAGVPGLAAPLSLQLICASGSGSGAPGRALSWDSVPRTAQSRWSGQLFQESEHGMCLISSSYRKCFSGCSISLVNSPSLILFFSTAVSFIFKKDFSSQKKKKNGIARERLLCAAQRQGWLGSSCPPIPVGTKPVPALGCR